ncbi:MAG: carbonic anhydrase [Ruminococcus sp.]|uniref:carbonic anhydrase n=1 Tax=Ruminococcus sp. TaxID=41978 RepID=UPI0025DB4B1D|nr:carbonic anhydrase [Ruminococcus sp.]MBR5681905.1 carbonic anhydrase [Ruminococcus sp.]
MQSYRITAEEAKKRLINGNQRYIGSDELKSDVSPDTLLRFSRSGQQPYAIIITCSDSRVVPELIFSAGIGDLFVIRVAGNVIDSHQLGSIEYAAEHLGTGLIVVLGHDHCGAVDAAMNHEPDGYIRYITDEIVKAIGDEKDEVRACCLNVRHSCDIIEHSLQIQKDEEEYGLKVLGAIYHLESGKVEFL